MNFQQCEKHALANSRICFFTVFDKKGSFAYANPYFLHTILPFNINQNTFFNLLNNSDLEQLAAFINTEEDAEGGDLLLSLDLQCSAGNPLFSHWEFKKVAFCSDESLQQVFIEAIGVPQYINNNLLPVNDHAFTGASAADNAFNTLLANQAEDPYKFLFYKNPHPMWIYDVATLRFLEVNEAAVNHYGYSRDELLGMNLKELRPEIELKRFMAQQAETEVHKPMHKGVWKHIKKNGEIIDVRITAHLLQVNNRPAKLVLAEDITHQLRAEDNLFKSNERYNYASKATFDAIWDWDFKSNKRYYGEGFKMLFGYDINENFDDLDSWYNHIHPEDVTRVKSSINRAIEKGATNWTEEYKFEKADGTYAYVADRGIIVRDELGNGVRMIGAMQDITIRKVNEQQLQKINLQLLRQQKERELTASILRSISEHELLNDALEDILRKLTIFFNFEISEVWFLNLDRKRLELRQKWFGTKTMGLFYKIHSDITFKLRDESEVAEEQWIKNEITFIDDLQKHASFQRKEGARQLDLTKCLLVPIVFKNETIALFSFFGKKEITEKDKVRSYFESLSIQLGIDIRRKKTEEELNKFFNLSPDVLTILGFDGYFKKINKAFSNIIGFDQNTILSQNSSFFIHPDDLEPTLQKMEEARSGKSVRFENRYLTNSGHYKWLIWATTPLVEEELLYATAKDITDKKELDEKLNRILESISDGFLTVDEEFRILYWNKQAENLLTLQRENVLGKKLNDLFANYLPDDFFDKYSNALETNEAVHIEEFIPKRKIWFEVNAYPYKGILSIFFKDVTRKKESDEIVRISNEKYEVLAKATKDTIWDWNLVTNHVSWNEGLRTMFGYTDIKEIKGVKWWSDRLHPDDKLRVMEKIDTHIQNYQAHWEDEYRFRCADNLYKYVYDRGFTLYNDKKEPVRMIGAMQDLSETKANEMVLKELNESLEKRAAQLATSNAELESFAYVASHDLQEPLRMVSSFLQLIEKRYKDKLDQKAHEYIRFAVDGAERMKGLILDLLEYSRVNSRKEQKEPVDLKEVAENLMLTYKEIIEEAEGKLEIDPLPVVNGNKLQLMQLFQNLVGNALKYRSEQPPHIKVSVFDEEENYRFVVQDNGIGIEPRFFTKIFVIFQRLHNKNDYSGTGIGLAICKKIIDIHSGKIWVESVPGEGSRFLFTLPKQTEEPFLMGEPSI